MAYSGLPYQDFWQLPQYENYARPPPQGKAGMPYIPLEMRPEKRGVPQAPQGPQAPQMPPIGSPELREQAMSAFEQRRPVLKAAMSVAKDWFQGLTREQRGYLMNVLGGYDSSRPNPTQGMFEAGQEYLANLPGPGDPFTLGPQDIRYDAAGNEIAHNPYERGPVNDVDVNMPAGMPEYLQQIWSDYAKSIGEDREGALEAAGNLDGTLRAFQLVNEGVTLGTFATYRNALENFLLTIGWISPDSKAGQRTARTQEYIANRADAVAQVIQRFGAGTGLSDADREYARQVAGGQIEMSEDAIRAILTMELIANWNVASRFNEDLSLAAEAAGDYPFPYQPVQLPEDIAPLMPQVIQQWRGDRAAVLTEALGLEEFNRRERGGDAALEQPATARIGDERYIPNVGTITAVEGGWMFQDNIVRRYNPETGAWTPPLPRNQ